MGSLLENKRDPSGLLYRRHRYLDTQAGRFTQEDPIGLAGGLNAYNYADGDPVNFEDPFGLCPQWLTGRPCSGGVDLGASFIPGVSSGIDAATVLTGENPLTGEQVGLVGRGIALAGLITPASGGQIRAASKFVSDAAGALASRIGKNSVTVATENGFRRIDLVGKAHGGVPTPHVHTYTVHTNPATGASRTKKEFKGPATRQDVIDAARASGQIP
jgi:RHS repeat-associated protein